MCAAATFKDFDGDIVILSGDVPLIREETLREMVGHHRNRRAAVTLLTTVLDEPKGYGRILRDGKSAITAIVEEKDASEAQRKVHEINAGVYVASASFLFAALDRIHNDNQQGEYYLPDIVAIALGQGKKVETVQASDGREVMGINSREELAFMWSFGTLFIGSVAHLVGTPKAIAISGLGCAVAASLLLYQQRQTRERQPIESLKRRVAQ